MCFPLENQTKTGKDWKDFNKTKTGENLDLNWIKSELNIVSLDCTITEFELGRIWTTIQTLSGLEHQYNWTEYGQTGLNLVMVSTKFGVNQD